jgi:hypothetical protein
MNSLHIPKNKTCRRRLMWTASVSRPALRSAQPPTKWVPGVLSPSGNGEWFSIPGRGKVFFFWPLSRPTLRPTQPPIQWVPGVLSPGGNGDWDSIPDRGKNFSCSLCVQTSYKALPASYPLGVVGPFPGVNRGRGVTLTTHLHLVRRSRMARSCRSSPPCPEWW